MRQRDHAVNHAVFMFIQWSSHAYTHKCRRGKGRVFIRLNPGSNLQDNAVAACSVVVLRLLHS